MTSRQDGTQNRVSAAEDTYNSGIFFVNVVLTDKLALPFNVSFEFPNCHGHAKLS